MEENFKNVNIDIGLTEKTSFENLYQNGYSQKLHNDFIENKEEKKHNINSHSNWFNKKIKINHEKENIQVINKWKLCMVDYGMNIGTEINGTRPSIIIKSNTYLQGEDIFVIPITSYNDGENKSIDTFDVEILPDKDNNLKNKSLIKIRQLRCISKKRIRSKKGSDVLNIFGEINDRNLRELIENNLRRIFGI